MQKEIDFDFFKQSNNKNKSALVNKVVTHSVPILLSLYIVSMMTISGIFTDERNYEIYIPENQYEVKKEKTELTSQQEEKLLAQAESIVKLQGLEGTKYKKAYINTISSIDDKKTIEIAIPIDTEKNKENVYVTFTKKNDAYLISNVVWKTMWN